MSTQFLRVAQVWQGTLIQERDYRRGGSVWIGATSKCDFVAGSAEGDEAPQELLSDLGSGARYTLGLRAGWGGKLTLRGTAQSVEELGAKNVEVAPGDWGVVTTGETAYFFQFVDDDTAVPKGAALRGVDYNIATANLYSATVHIGLLMASFLNYMPSMGRAEIEIDDRFVRILADEPPDVIEEVIEEEAMDESTSKAAGGEEGRFGEEDAEQEDSVLPDHDGPLVDHLESTELGRAFDAAIGQTGALSNVFGSSDMFANTFGQDFATAGEGDAFIVGRGSGGLGMRGTGSGGGGDGFGRVHGVGEVDTGGGRGQGASLGRRGAQAPRARVERGSPNVNGFLTREQIERVVRRHSRGIRYCYERELQNDPTLAGRVSVNWTIGLDGRVQSASITENSMSNRDVESCILREVQRMRFDQPDGGMVVVTYPFTFRSEEGEGGGEE